MSWPRLPAGVTLGGGEYVVGDLVVDGPMAAVHRGLSRSGTSVLITVASHGDPSAFPIVDVRDDTRYVARLLHVGRVGAGTGLPAIVEEEPAGAPLTRWFAEAVDLDAFASAAERLCWALHSLHEAGCLAVQLQPDLIYMEAGVGWRFVSGVAARGPGFLASCLGDQDARSALDHDLVTLAPEVLDGSAVSAASDVFSLCVVLSRWLEGRHPFQGSTTEDVRAAIIEGRRYEWHGPLALEPIREVLRTGLDAAPERRPDPIRLAVSIGDACRDRHPVGRWRGVVARPSHAPPPSRGQRPWRAGDVIAGLYRIEPVVEDGEVRPAHLSGGMGLVYRMRHLAWGIDLAVKVPRPELFSNEEQRRRFELEVETWVSLGLHPNVVACHYLRRIDDLPCVFADYRAGGTVASAIADGRLHRSDGRAALANVLDLSIQIAWGLAHAHRAGVVHQDVKPGNVLLDGDVAQVSDFGLAQARGVITIGSGIGTDAPPDRSIVVPGSGGLTPAYASPEQIGRAPLTVTTDVWSWALIVLELLCGGRRWMIGPAARESLGAVRAGDGAVVPGRDVVELLDTCLDLDPSRRPRDLTAVAAQLQSVWEDQQGRPFPRVKPELATSLADGLSNEALSYLDLGRPADAERRWDRALEADPRHPHTVFNRGLHEWRSGRISDAELVRRMEDVRRSHEDDWLDEYLLGLVHTERNDTSAARELLQDVVRRQPDHPEVTDALAALEAQPSPAGRKRRFVGGLRVVRSVALSGDGQFAVAGGWGGVEVWHLESAQRVASLDRGQLGSRVDVTAVDIVTGGDRAIVAMVGDLASGRRRLEVCGLDLQGFRRRTDLWTGTLLEPMRSFALTTAGTVVSLDADASTVAVAGNGLTVWDVRTGAVVFEAEVGATVTSMARSADGRTIVVASQDAGVRTFVLGTSPSDVSVMARADAVAITSDGGRVVLAGRSIVRRDLAGTNELTLAAPGTDPRFRSVAVSGEASVAMTIEVDGTLRLWDLEAGRCLRTFFEQSARALSVAVAPAGDVAVTGGDDGFVCIWQLPLGNERVPWSYARPLAAEVVSDAAVAVRRAGSEAAALLAQGAHRRAAEVIVAARAEAGWRRDPGLVRAWQEIGRHGRRRELVDAWVGNVRTAPVRHALEDVLPGFQPAAIRCNAVASTPDGRRVLLARSASIQVWEEGHDAPVRTITLGSGGGGPQSDGAGGFIVQPREVRSVCITSDGRLALSAAQGDVVRVWDVEAGTMISTLGDDDAHTVAVAGRGTVAVSAGWRAAIDVWDPQRGWRLLTLPSDGVVGTLAMAADGRSAAAASARVVTVWDLGAGEPTTLEQASAPVRTLALTPDGRFCAAGLEGGGADLFHVQARRRISTLAPRPGQPGGSAPHVALAADGRAVLVSGVDAGIEVWTVVGGDRRVLEPPGGGGERGRPFPVAMTEDATRVLAGAADGSLVSWTLDWTYDFEPSDA